MVVKYCNFIPEPFQQTKDSGFSKNYLVEHIGKECVITCFSGKEMVTRKIQVIGMHNNYIRSCR